MFNKLTPIGVQWYGEVCFDSIRTSKWFGYNEMLYTKIPPVTLADGSVRNAMRMDTGELLFFEPNAQVYFLFYAFAQEFQRVSTTSEKKGDLP